MDVETLQAKFAALAPEMTERARRIWAATEAIALGRGGISLVHSATGLARSTIARGMREVRAGVVLAPGRTRHEGGGRRSLVATDETLLADLEALVEPGAAGDPQSPLRWTSKSTRNLAVALQGMGHSVGPRTVAQLLKDIGYSLQANRKTRESASHADRDAQFGYINRQVKRRQRAGQPVISVDTKKKELVGDFKRPGREYRPKKNPERVRVHDFIIPELGKAIPYGVYDVTQNSGWVSVGVNHDTATFAVSSINRWWNTMGAPIYPNAESLLITADCGGSNGPRVRLWKLELQRFADETGLSVTVCHFPPGTSKWNKIEHRLFSYISANWRGRPLTSLAVIVSLIASTRTATGLHVRCELDEAEYAKGAKVTDEEMAALKVRKHRFHGDWNYTIYPRPPSLK